MKDEKRDLCEQTLSLARTVITTTKLVPRKYERDNGLCEVTTHM